MICETCKIEMLKFNNFEATLYVCLKCGLSVTKLYLNDEELERFNNEP